jgi:hypothetical protein
MHLRFLTLVTWAGALAFVICRNSAGLPPRELCSPDKKYCVKIETNALPGADPDRGFFTLVIAREGTVISRFPTEGYLIDAFWSNENHYVAINNRRANNGDYLWVIRLADSKALRVPDDQNVVRTIDRISAKFPELSRGNLQRGYIAAGGWVSPTRLRVWTQIQFKNLDDAVIRVDDIYEIHGEKLHFRDGFIKKVFWDASAEAFKD